MRLKSPGHLTYFGVVDEFHLFRINAPYYLLSCFNILSWDYVLY